MRKFGLTLSVLSLLLIGSLPAQARIVKTISFKSAHCQHPKWSRNGKQLSFEVNNVRKRVITLRILDRSTGKIKVLRPDVTKNRLQLGGMDIKRGVVSREMAWGRGGKYMYSSNGNGAVYDLYLGGEGRVRVSHRSKNDGQASWSKKGKFVVFTSARTGKGDLYFFNVSQMKARRLTKDNNSTEFFPTFSPKKKLMVAYVRHTDQTDRIRIIKNIFSKKSRRLTKWKKNLSELNPSWSPDGKRIAFFTVNSQKVYNLYVATLNGKVTRLARNVIKSDQYGPAWSPDSKKIFYVQKLAQNKDRIYAINIATKKRKAIRTGTQDNNELAVTKRGGKWFLAFTGLKGSKGSDYRQLFVKQIKPF